jgi:protein-S-isoprenylcysteine O-methyltransferase Ste14
MWSDLMLAVCLFWFLSEIYINIARRSSKMVSDSFDHNSLNIIWFAIILSTALGVYIAITFPMFNETKYLAGEMLIIAGLILRFFAMFALKKFFTSNISIHHEHKLKTDGIYGLIRHPSYTGSLLSFLGLGFALGNWISILVIFIPVLLAFLHRINLEEQVLVKNFKDEYIQYQKRTRKLIPFIY